MTIPLFLRAIGLLLITDWILRARGLDGLTTFLKGTRMSQSASSHDASDICYAVDLACVLYFKQVLCLQRSVVTGALLRYYGLRAELVIGARILPFGSHAWIEVDRKVVNDKPYVGMIYNELDRI